MSATERLRELLDERGVKHEGSERSVRWRDRNGVIMQAFPLTSGELGLEVWSCTPEQAIAATLGSGTCVNMDGETDAEWFTCSECNTELRVHEPFDAFSIHYCPNCGKRVVE